MKNKLMVNEWIELSNRLINKLNKSEESECFSIIEPDQFKVLRMDFIQDSHYTMELILRNGINPFIIVRKSFTHKYEWDESLDWCYGQIIAKYFMTSWYFQGKLNTMNPYKTIKINPTKKVISKIFIEVRRFFNIPLFHFDK